MRLFLKKGLVVLLICTLSFGAYPHSAKAQLVVHDPISYVVHSLDLSENTITAVQSVTGLQLKDGLNGVAWSVAKMIIATMTKSLVRWINSGFSGSPSFVGDLQGHLQNVGFVAARTFVNQLLTSPAIRSPFQNQVGRLVQMDYLQATSQLGFFTQNAYSLSNFVKNDVAFVNGDFSQGGWAGWMALAQPQNNIYGATILANAQLSGLVASAQTIANTKLGWGQGFLSWCGTSAGSSSGGSDGWSGGGEPPSGSSPSAGGSDGGWGGGGETSTSNTSTTGNSSNSTQTSDPWANGATQSTNLSNTNNWLNTNSGGNSLDASDPSNWNTSSGNTQSRNSGGQTQTYTSGANVNLNPGGNTTGTTDSNSVSTVNLGAAAGLAGQSTNTTPPTSSSAGGSDGGWGGGGEPSSGGSSSAGGSDGGWGGGGETSTSNSSGATSAKTNAGVIDSSSPNPSETCTNKDGSPGTIQTPGSVIQAQINKTLGLQGDTLVTANEFNQVIGALMSQLVNQVVGATGLLGVSQPSSGGGSSYLDRAADPSQFSSNSTSSGTTNSFSQAVSSEIAQLTQYKSDWQKISDEASAAHTSLTTCQTPIPGASDVVSSVQTLSTNNLLKATGALSSLAQIQNTANAATTITQDNSASLSAAATNFQTIISSSSTPSAADINNATQQAVDDYSGGTTLDGHSWYGQMHTIIEACTMQAPRI